MNEVDHEARFKQQPSLPKKEVMKLKPGTFIEVKWCDAPNCVVLLVAKPDDNPGPVELKVFDLSTGYAKAYRNNHVHSHVSSDQVVAVRGMIEFPEPETVVYG